MLVAWLMARSSSKRMGIVDKGWLGTRNLSEYLFGTIAVHNLCQTRLRVGVAPNGRTVVYCWRCERILESTNGERSQSAIIQASQAAGR